VKPDHSKRDEGMEEKRRAPRIKEDDEVTITVVSGGENLPEEAIKGSHTKDISVCGAKIQTNILLPVNTILELDFTSKGVHQKVKVLGKVTWSKVISENESYELGVEFYPSKEVAQLGDYISWRPKSNESEFIKHKVPSIDSGNKNIVETKKEPPIKNKQWIKIVILSSGTIISIVVLLNIFGFISLYFIYPPANKKITNNFTHDSITTKSAIIPAPPIVAPAPKATPNPAPVPALEVTQKTKVIGNSDSKRYHLTGMKHYNAVKAYHLVEFDSEADAIKAGYSKASR
jgi:hypothetical protein